MDHKTQNILEELYAIDPSLRDAIPDIEVLVSTLMTSKPEVQINQQFIYTLRRKLVAQADTALKKDADSREFFTSLSTWVFRLTPIGALAVVLLALFPGIDNSSVYPTGLYTSESVMMGGGGDGVRGSTFKSSGVMEAESQAEMTSPMPSITFVTIDSVTLERPGRMVITTEFAEIVGESEILPSGITTGVRIELTRPINPGEVLIPSTVYDEMMDSGFISSDIMEL